MATEQPRELTRREQELFQRRLAAATSSYVTAGKENLLAKPTEAMRSMVSSLLSKGGELALGVVLGNITQEEAFERIEQGVFDNIVDSNETQLNALRIILFPEKNTDEQHPNKPATSPYIDPDFGEGRNL